MLLLMAAMEIHRKVPDLEYIQLERGQLHIRSIIRYVRMRILRDNYRYSQRRKSHSKEKRRRIVRRLHAMIHA